MTSRLPFATATASLVLSLTAAAGGDLPPLHSLPGAPASLYLNFKGAPAQTWVEFKPPATPPYAGPDADARTVYDVVADAYAPFDIDVTTVAPADLTRGHTAIVNVGGTNAWVGQPLGGTSKPTGFWNPNVSNVAWVFSDSIGNNPRFVGCTAAHESGHLFGLQHHAVYDAAGNQTSAYDYGNALVGPVMGGGFSSARVLWYAAPNDVGVSTVQADMSIIAGPAVVQANGQAFGNGFGYRPWTAGQSVAAATPLAVGPGGVVTAAGVVEQRTADLSDADAAFTATSRDTYAVPVAAAGPATFTVTPPPLGMLHARLRLLDAAGHVLGDGDRADTMGQTVTAAAAAGTVYVEVSSFGGYGDVGRYALSGTVPATAGPTVAAAAAPVVTPAAVGPARLSGTVIGTAGSWRGQGNTAARAFDGRVDTFFDAPAADGGWCGLDLGTAEPIAALSYAPRAGFAGRMAGGRFEAAADPAFATVIASYTVTAAPPPGLTRIVLPTPVTARFVRYVGPPGSNCNIAEFQLTAAGR